MKDVFRFTKEALGTLGSLALAPLNVTPLGAVSGVSGAVRGARANPGHAVRGAAMGWLRAGLLPFHDNPYVVGKGLNTAPAEKPKTAAVDAFGFTVKTAGAASRAINGAVLAHGANRFLDVNVDPVQGAGAGLMYDAAVDPSSSVLGNAAQSGLGGALIGHGAVPLGQNGWRRPLTGGAIGALVGAANSYHKAASFGFSPALCAKLAAGPGVLGQMGSALRGAATLGHQDFGIMRNSPFGGGLGGALSRGARTIGHELMGSQGGRRVLGAGAAGVAGLGAAGAYGLSRALRPAPKPVAPGQPQV